ncbi:alpha-amylase family glycosyl hydrolase [Haliovirga abyssi]|uniref:Alpha-amylase n=1 Tax=Haliovirga abyssi TaxID=2996794 RepID=A0AAU9E2T1_9FUSO|nr:alpha-amylase family glycosyl hydrolase [Haliovirga abyssi]BDU50715.1 alpha-amylase [Haliovirga abyssi]
MNKNLILYNLFPKAAGKISDWIDYLDEIKYMGFNSVYLNPIYETGFSGSLYAPRDFYKINNNFIDDYFDGSPEEQLKNFVEEAHKRGLKVIFEMIVTHTSIDSELLLDHPEWYKYNGDRVKSFSANDNLGFVEWADLAEIDNYNSAEKENLWLYWEQLAKYYISTFDIDGFKCSTAYKVPIELWNKIIKSSKEIKNDIIFIADNLGSDFNKMVELARGEFDYLFTSLKWWDFNETWFLEQHYTLKNLVGLISFPESYNTERIVEEYGEMCSSKSWYGLSAFMNSGVMLPIGYEFGVEDRLDVIMSSQIMSEDKRFNISDYIKRINEIKNSYNIFQQETELYFLDFEKEKLVVLKKSTDIENVLLIINLDFDNHIEIKIEDLKSILDGDEIIDISPEDKQNDINNFYKYKLSPGEIRVLYSKK